MGIKGLLSLLKGATQSVHISHFKGRTAAIDMMSWLYKGTYAIAEELIRNFQNPNERCLSFIGFPVKMLKMMESFQIKVICVFDGRFLALKKETMEKRHQSKSNYMERARQALSKGDIFQATRYLERGVSVNRWMVDFAVDAIKALNFEVLVAPYQADSQIAYMVREGHADFAISQDSDLLVFGCPVLLTKLKKDGKCELIDLPKIKDAYENKDPNNPIVLDKTLKQVASLKPKQFMEMCVLSGCDYLPSVQGIGLKTATKMIYERRTAHLALNALKQNKAWTKKVSKEYMQQFQKVMLCFLYQRVFKYPERNQVICANGEPLPQDVLMKWGKEIINKYTGQSVPDNLCEVYSYGQLYLGDESLRQKIQEEMYSEEDIVKGLNGAGYSFDMCKYGYDPTARKSNKKEEELKNNELDKMLAEIHQNCNDEQNLWIGAREEALLLQTDQEAKEEVKQTSEQNLILSEVQDLLLSSEGEEPTPPGDDLSDNDLELLQSQVLEINKNSEEPPFPFEDIEEMLLADPNYDGPEIQI